MKKLYDIGIEKAKFNEKMRELRHNLECQNIANLMGILCMERRKCLAEKSAIEKYYLSRIARLTEKVDTKTDKTRELMRALEDSNKQIDLRETCILEILKQFQKFINFVLKSAPTQAEFLLSVEKLMVFELTNNILKSNVNVQPCEVTLKWKEPTQPLKQDTPNLTLSDGHNCMNEVPLPSPDDMLPSFTYKDKLYVREEFRDILSQLDHNTGSKRLSLNDEEDVQLLIKLMKASVKPNEVEILPKTR